ncbi:MAG: amino acid adenylation domain-containing protein [Chloroflexi bacterium]|nr:amino acid adenylation domain-containing protein [Chloroflexota bacterium]
MSDASDQMDTLSPEKRELLELLLAEGGDQLDMLPLSFAQQRMWLLNQLEPDSSLYNMPAAVRLIGDLNVAALEGSLNQIIQRHEILHTTFQLVDDQPVQIIHPWQPLTLPVQDLRALGGNDPAALQRLAVQEARRPFDLVHGPLLRASLLQTAAHEHVLLLTLHHIVADGWSITILIQELAAFYRAFVDGTEPDVPELPIQYADYAVWQREQLSQDQPGNLLDEQLAYWRHQLDPAGSGELPVLDLPTDRPRPAMQSYRGARYPLAISQPVTQAIKDLSRSENVTPFMTLVAAFNTLLFRYTGQRDLLIGTPTASRTQDEIEGLIGCFVNTLVLRTTVVGNPAFRDLLRQARATLLGAYNHQDLPFEMLVEALHIERDLSRAPLVQVMFAFHNRPFPALALPGLDLELLDVETGTAKFDLTFSLEDAADGLRGEIEYNTDLFDQPTIARMAEHFQLVLAAIVANPDVKIADLPLLTIAEQQQFAEWNRTQVATPHACLHRLVEMQATSAPEVIAVSHAGRTLTYAELDRQANQIARHLQKLGIAPEMRVGVCLDRSPDLIVALVGILKAGGCYVPLDPAYPQERLAFLIRDAQISILVTERPFDAHLPAHVAQIVYLDQDWPQINAYPTTAPDSRITPDNLAYVIYTSGSTGQPKGVAVTHRSVANLVDWHCRTFALRSDDRTTQIAGMAFDAMAWEVWPALAAGAALVIPDDETRATPALLQAWLREQEITISFVPTPLTERLLALDWHAPLALRTLLTGGDRLHIAPPVTLSFTLVNNYGPTEATIVATSGSVPPTSSDAPPSIGRPISNTEIYLLSAQLQPVPLGVLGEVYIGGGQLARGYLNRPDLTAARFIPDLFSQIPGSRLYRTGDLARYRADGTIEFVGRVDQQVKLRGFRIELGEIEATLVEHPQVREAVVLLRQAASGDRRLVAYVVGEQTNKRTKEQGNKEQQDHQDLSLLPSPTAVGEGLGVRASGEGLIAALRAHLGAHLPDYMVPSGFVLLDELPLTPNGKVDQRALLAVDLAEIEVQHAFVAPRTPTEELVAALWRELLRGVPSGPGPREQIGTQDNFFELGGHSLLATQVTARLRQVFGVELPVRALFEAPTVAGLAKRIEQTQQAEAVPPIVPISRAGDLPLSFAQERLWFLNQLDPGSAAFNLPYYVQLRGALDVSALEGSLNTIIQRHEVLRTTFPPVAGQPVQRIVPELSLHLQLIDLRQHAPDQRQSELRRLIESESRQSFNLLDDVLLRAKLVQLADDEHVLLLTMHHIVADGWSQAVFTRELSALYAALRQNQPPQIAALPIQYADYAVWQRQWLQDEVLAQQVAYWRQQLQPNEGRLPVLDLPTDRPRPAIQTFNGATVAVDLPAELTAALKSVSQHEGATLFMTLLAAFQALLYRYTGQRDFGVGSPIANRTRQDLEGLIGFFVNMLVLRADIAPESSFRDLLRNVRETALGAYAHQDLPFEKLVEELQLERDLSRSPLFQVMFVLQNVPAPALELSGIEVCPLEVPNQTAKYDLTLTLAEIGDRVTGTFEYNTDLFEPATIARMAGHFQTLLAAIVADPDRQIPELPLLGADERRLMLLDWNATGTPYAADACIHQFFEAQVERTPDAVALVFRDQQLSYRELNARANQLARHLRSLGVVPDALVGIYMERSLDMVIAMLAVLKAGAAYLPLDPAYPQERIGFMIADANVAVLLTEPQLAGLQPQDHAQIVALERAWPQIAQLSEQNLSTAALPHNLAYVIYTSGSTGIPKGVMVSHRNVANFVAGMDQRIGSDPGTWLALTSISFDISVLELLWTLARGFKVVLHDERRQLADTLDVDQVDDSLPSQLACHQVTHLQCTPSQARMLLSEPDAVAAWQSVRTLLLGGEALPVDLARQLLDQFSAELHNMYGPTETTIWSATHHVKTVEASIPLGRPIANTEIYILDAQLAPVPIGVAGELYIGGAGVVRGYLNRPGLTAERFIPDSFSQIPGSRLYRTGDLVRYRPDGTIDFLGRADTQVKLRGFRIELGEIEAELRQHEAVRDAVVIVRDERLVAYVVEENLESRTQNLGGEGEAGSRFLVLGSTLRAFLASRLPDYMIPAMFVTLDALPLTPNGKLDRRALPAPSADRPELAASYIAPRNDLEQRIAEIWAAVLHLERVGVDDNFFELGGTSLLLVQARTRLREALGRDVPLVELFQYPSISALARHLSAAPSQSPSSAAMDKVRQQAERQKQARQQKRTTRRSTS